MIIMCDHYYIYILNRVLGLKVDLRYRNGGPILEKQTKYSTDKL